MAFIDEQHRMLRDSNKVGGGSPGLRPVRELRGLGYQGGYDAVRRYARSWHREHAAMTAALVPLSFAPGEAYQGTVKLLAPGVAMIERDG